MECLWTFNLAIVFYVSCPIFMMIIPLQILIYIAINCLLKEWIKIKHDNSIWPPHSFVSLSIILMMQLCINICPLCIEQVIDAYQLVYLPTKLCRHLKESDSYSEIKFHTIQSILSFDNHKFPFNNARRKAQIFALFI